MKKFLILSLSLVVLLANAAIPAGYYGAAEGKADATLKTQLSSIISAGYKDVGYDGLYDVYKTSDILPNGKIWDMYSMKADGTAAYYFTPGSDECGSYAGEGACYNREHTFCDSWLGEASPQRSDAHHLIPTDGYVNNRRSSYPHGKVGSASWTSSNGSKVGSSDGTTGYSGTVFEPIDEYKGDFARMYFYVATRYESKIAGWAGNGSAGEILSGNTYPAYKAWFYNLLIQWNALDPVSQKERNRNDAVYAYQKNRNPYIDYPELADYIWGTKKGQAWFIGSASLPTITSPISGSTLDFGNVAYLQNDTAGIFIKGINLTGNLNLSISGDAASKFVLPVSSVTKEQATEGIRIIITYKATAIENSNALLTISGTDVSPAEIYLTASATDEFLALGATDITPTSFKAHWTSSVGASGYSLNVFKLTGTVAPGKTLMEDDFNAGLPAGWTATGYYDVLTSSNIRMSSGSKSCLLTTGTVDLNQPTVLTVKSKQYSTDTDARLWVIAGSNDTITNFLNTKDYQTFTCSIPAKSATTLSFYTAVNKRVYFEYFKLETPGLPQTRESVAGYPKSVGNSLLYEVSGLENNTNYYYTVTPEGNTTGISNVISVLTTVSANVNAPNQKMYWYAGPGFITVKNLPENCRIMLTDSTGKIMAEMQSESGEVNLYPPDKGIYLLRIVLNDKSVTEKIVF